MAQRAIIGINGDPIPFDETLDKLRTQGIGGGSVTWVPDADTRCVGLRAVANGNYAAADAGAYGWDNITVSIKNTGSVTGTKNGVTYRVTVDDSGDLVYTRILGGDAP